MVDKRADRAADPVRIREVRIIDAADTYTQKEEEGNSRPFNTAGRINSVIQRST